MNNLVDYKIIQRNKDGYATVTWKGEYKFAENQGAAASVVREDDNTIIVPWTKCTMEGNKWSVTLNVPEGGLYRAEVRVYDHVFLRTDGEIYGDNFNQYATFEWTPLIAAVYHFGVGDVFLLTGQSNMSGYGRDTAYDPATLGVHLLANDQTWKIATHPVCSPVNSPYGALDHASGTSPSLSFGRTMMRNLGVPVGLVAASLGGVPLAPYDPDYENHYMYDMVIEQLKRVGDVAGIVWYQGCSDTGTDEAASTYFDRFNQMITKLRKVVGNVPVVQAQLNRHMMDKDYDDIDRRWGMVRDAQRRAALEMEDSYTVPTFDLGMTDGIHNSSGGNVILGERLASALLQGHYGKVGTQPPIPVSAEKISATEIKVHFNEKLRGLQVMDNIPLGLHIEDEDGIMDCPKAESREGELIVTAPREIKGKAQFHAYWRSVIPAFIIRDIRGMPMLGCYGMEIEE